MKVLVILLIVYFIPTIIAMLHSHCQRLAIFVLSLFLGWTLLGWVIALVWSVMALPARHPDLVFRDQDRVRS